MGRKVFGENPSNISWLDPLSDACSGIGIGEDADLNDKVASLVVSIVFIFVAMFVYITEGAWLGGGFRRLVFFLIDHLPIRPCVVFIPDMGSSYYTIFMAWQSS